MAWDVKLNKFAEKQADELDEDILSVFRLLKEDLTLKGPIPGRRWKNYSKIKGSKEDERHCHIAKGRPTYVCCWRVFKSKKLIEVYYVGTHEKAPY